MYGKHTFLALFALPYKACHVTKTVNGQKAEVPRAVIPPSMELLSGLSIGVSINQASSTIER